MIEVDANDCEMNAAAILDLTHQESWSSLTMRNGPANVLDGPFDPPERNPGENTVYVYVLFLINEHFFQVY